MEKATLNKLTPYQKMKMERNRKICEEYVRLTANPEQSKMEVNHYLIKKYGLVSVGSIYKILQKGGVR